MCRKLILSILLFLYIVLFFSAFLFSMEPELNIKPDSSAQSDSNHKNDKPKNTFYTLRLGVGGFADDRSPKGKLMGGQLVFDFKPFKFPIAGSVSLVEFYSSSSDPQYSYQIQNMGTFNILYITKPFNSKYLKVFCGGGLGGSRSQKMNRNMRMIMP